MSRLIDDLLNLSLVTRSGVRRKNIDLSAMARSIADELRAAETARQVEFTIETDLTATGDFQLLRAAMENLLHNSWKYTSAHPCARIEFGKSQRSGEHPFSCVTTAPDLTRGMRTVYSVLPTASHGGSIPRQRRRAGHGATNHPQARRRDLGGKVRSEKARRSILLCDEKTGEKKGLWTTIVLLVENNPDDEARILRESSL
jgi:hypothetical protein